MSSKLKEKCRLIKFRVFDTISKEMWMPEQGGYYCVTQVGTVCVDETASDEGGVLESRDYRSIAMQFTGLTDKNGVEIYEGDFLKMDDLIIPVVFDDGSFQIKTNNYQGSSHLMQDRARRFEVCGNIYQNPELLK